MSGKVMEGKVNEGHRERLRKEFLDRVEKGITEEAILELLLSYAIPQKDVRPLAQALVERFGTIDQVFAADFDHLTSTDGVKACTATLLKLVDWIRVHYNSQKRTGGHGTVRKVDQSSLFEMHVHGEDTGERPLPRKKSEADSKPFRQSQPCLFSNAVLKEAITLLPELPENSTLSRARDFLRNRLHFSARSTRIRYSNYILSRMFPSGVDFALPSFSRLYRGKQELRDVCFYRFGKAEPLMFEIVNEVLLPALGPGQVARRALKQYLAHRFPSAKNMKDPAQAAVDAITASGIGKADKRNIYFSYRDLLIPPFAFILYSEFPEPGMYDLSLIENSNVVKAMLWDPDRVLPALYELRNRNLVAKISEIDNVRQFTLKWTLEEMVANLASMASGPTG